MSFLAFPEYASSIQLLQRSLERGRLGHAYLFVGSRLEKLEAVARTLAKTLNCSQQGQGSARDCCDRCPSCRKIDEEQHPDINWVRPVSKLRVIRVDEMRGLIHSINLKPSQAAYKVGIIADADRLNESAANAFLKTLEEPPQRSILILLSTDPTHILETILSRCLRLSFVSNEDWRHDHAQVAWLDEFGKAALKEGGSLLSRYRLLSVLLKQLAALRSQVESKVEQQSPLERYEDVEPDLQEKWEKEMAAAVEAEYRRQRTTLLTSLQWWLRDVWLQTLSDSSSNLAFPDLEAASRAVARRIGSREAMANLAVMEHTQGLLSTNIQEPLALEVGLLKLKL